MSPDVQTILHSGAELTDRALERLLPPADTLPSSIQRAMRHSTFAGGKRLRPVLCMESARIFSAHGKLPAGIEDLAAALEMLHTYSLVHDDLPALDNDDLRRGSRRVMWCSAKRLPFCAEMRCRRRRIKRWLDCIVRRRRRLRFWGKFRGPQARWEA